MAGEIGILIDGFTMAQISQIIASIEGATTSKPGITIQDNRSQISGAVVSHKTTTKIGIIIADYDLELAAFLAGEI